jgi:peptide/nickel transport system substrate-binding protein
VRFDDWKSGPLPKLRRIVQRDVPNAGNRRALLLKGDIDITYDLPPKDFAELAQDGGARQGEQPRRSRTRCSTWA